MIKRVFVLDNGLNNQTGHQFAMALSFRRALAARGLSCRYWVHDKADDSVLAGLDARPVFRSSPFARFSTDPLAGPILSATRAGYRFADDCEGPARDEGVGPDDVVLLPFALSGELDGLARWLAGIPAERRPRAVINIGYDDARHGAKDEPDPLWRAAQRMIGRRLVRDFAEPDLVLTTCGASAARVFAETLTYPVRDYPLAHDYGERAPGRLRPASGSGSLVVSVFGHSQKAKGFQLLPDIVRRCASVRSDLRFFIQVDPPKAIGNWSDDTPLGEDDPVELHHGALDGDSYFDRLEASDILLLPYNPSFYQDRTSGVFAEGVAFGKVCVVPNETWMSDQLEARRGVGGAFRSFSAESIADTLLKVADRWDELHSRTQRLVAPWRTRHSTAGFVQRMLEDLDGATDVVTERPRSND